MSASGLKNQSACSSNHWNQSTTFFQDQLKRSTPGNETQQDNEWKLCTQLWQLKWSNYHPMPKQCYLNILYSLTSPWFHRTWKILHVIHKRHVHRWDQVDKKVPVHSKKANLKRYQKNSYILVTSFVVFLSTKMKEKIKVKYLIIPPLSGN